jgi:cytochrome c2
MKARRSLIVAAAVVLCALMAPAASTHAQEQQQLQMSKAEKRQLFRRGAKIWPVLCGQCHNARPGGEFSPEQWTLIMRHMQTRSLIPAEDSKAVLVYLQSAHEPQ